MAEVINLALTEALGDGITGSADTVDTYLATTGLTLHHLVDNAVVASRLFPVAVDPDSVSYTRDATSSAYGVAFAGAKALLDTRLDVELLTAEQRYPGGIGIADDPCAFGDTDELGALSPTPGCLDYRVTWEQVARLALAEVGLGLVIYAGPGLPFNTRLVDSGYATIDKTVATVLGETLLQTDPRWWIDGDAVVIDGRALITGAVPYIAGMTSYRESILVAASIDDPVEPEIGTPVGCDDTFETSESGTLTWTDAHGSGDESEQIRYTLVKSGGSITQEVEERFAFVPTYSGDPVWAMVYRSEKNHTYHASCPEALLTSIETIDQARHDFPYWNLRILPGSGAFGKVQVVTGWLPQLIRTNTTYVYQRWHAEGWLKHRAEQHYEAGAIFQSLFNNEAGVVAYKKRTRTEEYTPIGNGQWWVREAEQASVDTPAYRMTGAPESGSTLLYTDFTIDTVYPLGKAVTRSYATDAGPPQVGCKQNPCESDLTPAEQAFQDYLFEVARVQAARSNQPRTKEVVVTLPGSRVWFQRGQFYGDAFVANVTFSLDSGDSMTEVTLWLKA